MLDSMHFTSSDRHENARAPVRSLRGSLPECDMAHFCCVQLRDTAIFTIKGGKVHERHRHSVAGYAAGEYKEMLETIASRLPDVRFVVNLLDEPRVLLGPGSVHDR
jgi:hypothetical protein